MKRLVPVLVALLLLPACGLPLPEGVRSAGDVQPVRDEPGTLRVIPPGPQADATPEEIVRGFLRAQSSPADDHAVARQFLAPGTEWDDERGAIVYRERRILATGGEGESRTFDVRFHTTARIQPTGAFVLDDGGLVAPYTVSRMPNGQFRLTSVPAGLHLVDADRERSFEPYDVYFLARGADGEPTGRLAPDRVFLPVTAERAPALVSSLLRGPTQQLSAAVQSAVPPEVEGARSVSVVDGLVTIDLPGEVRALDALGRQRLSAQLVWTLVPLFTGVRLLAHGAPLEVQGAEAVQTREDWPEYDPAVLGPNAPLYYVQGRKVRSLDRTLPASDATRPGPLAVDEVAVSPAGGALGLLTRSPRGLDEVRIGPETGPFGAAVLRRPSLGSLSWGPGDQGLWLLELGSAPRVCLLPPPGAPPRPDPCDVVYQPPAGAGPLAALQVSRDGARVAMVFGAGASRALYVGKVVPTAGRLRILVGPDPVAPGLSDVTDVAWERGTSLAVLAAAAPGASQVVVWTVAVDGSTRPAVVQRQGLEGEPLSVAAAPGRPLVVGTLVDRVPRVYRDRNLLFRLEAAAAGGSAPAYPG